MGVDGLWKLLEPSGSKISIESLNGLVLAIDASLWLVQFMKAMRKSNGDVIENAHLLGLFRRICKLLFYNVKPVFVFDGPPPALKRSTLRMRQIRREANENDIRKTAERLLLYQMKMAGIEFIKNNYKKKENKNENINNNENDKQEKSKDNIINHMDFIFEEDINHQEDKTDNMEESSGDESIDDDVLRPLQDTSKMQRTNSGDIFVLPENVSELSAADIAQYPASMQYEIMQRRRDQLRQEKRQEFFVASTDPEKYAQVQITNFLKTSQMNSQIEKIREKMINEYHKELLTQNQDGNDGTNGHATMHRIASEANTHYYYHSQWLGNDGNNQTQTQTQTHPNNIKGPIKRKFSEIDDFDNKYNTGNKRRKWNSNKNNNQYRPQTLSMSSSAAPTYDTVYEHWSCGKCKHLNLKQRTTCDVCGSIREQALAMWKCLLCEHMNEGTMNTCAICEYERQAWNSTIENDRDLHIHNKTNVVSNHNDVISKNDDSMLTWICAMCQWQNSHMVERCQQCECTRTHNNQSNMYTNSDPSESDNHILEDVPLLSLPTTLEEIELIPKKIETKSKTESPPDKNRKALMVLKNTRQNFHMIARLTQGTHLNMSLRDVLSSNIGNENNENENENKNKKENENENINININVNENEEGSKVTEEIKASDPTMSENNSDLLSTQIPTDFKIDVPTFEESDNEQKEHFEKECDEKSELEMKSQQDVEIELGPEIEMELALETKKEKEIQTEIENEIINQNIFVPVDTFEEWNDLEDQRAIMETQLLDDKVSETAKITPAMILECKQLLDMFGIPYIVSPAEAEAQCAELNRLGLVDGVVTDDSDVFLFDGQAIYRHLFHMDKNVEEYRSSQIYDKMGLSREKLIGLAMLLGSDYTEGIKGIGIVNGVEIIQAFCNNSYDKNITEIEVVILGLQEFRDWIYSPLKDKKPKGLKTNKTTEYIEYNKCLFKWKHRNIKKHWYVSRDFPPENVIQTYWKPNVESSLEKIQFGTPQVEQLEKLCCLKFSWDIDTVHKTLQPVIDTILNKESAQKRLDSYVHWSKDNSNLSSKRAQKAVTILSNIKTKE